jgi:predicted regulator of amino acid metabolism with ACT domain
MRSKILRWLERLPENTSTLVLRAGESRTDEAIIEKWSIPIEDVDDILDTIEDTMNEEYTGRLIAYNERAKQLRSVSVRGVPTVQQNTSETGALIDGILRMAEEQRRFVATITDSFQTMHETIQDALFVEREHHEEMADAQLALAMSQIDTEQNKESTIDKALAMVAQAMQSKNINIRDMILQNPDIIDEFLNDEQIIEIVTKKMTQ